jgi:hypothetical protein
MTMGRIVIDACERDHFTCQQCGKTMEHVEHYLVLHLVARTREARLAGDYELQCTRCLTSGQHSLHEVVLEKVSETGAPSARMTGQIRTLGTRVLARSADQKIGIIEAVDAVLAETLDLEDREVLEMMRKAMVGSKPPSSGA